MFERILVGSDGSDYALAAARVTAELAKKYNSTVTVVHVYQPPAIADPNGAIITALWDAIDEAHKWVAERTLAIFKGADVECRFVAVEGHPVDLILDAAKNEKADLIVLGSRGRSQFQRMLLGSVSDGVLHHAHCPVLIVR